MEITALHIGTTLHFGQYQLLKVLGRGGFGITYLAHDNALDKDVAIKEFFPSMLSKRDERNNQMTFATEGAREMLETLKRKFIKEARNIASLNHPNIIRIYTAFEENNTAYYVMEYIQGRSLSETIKVAGPMSYPKAKNYIDQIGSALDYMHKNGMTHFDVKPANIMVRSSDNRPILIDFGLSKNYDSNGMQTTTTGPLGVSPGFSPSEQYKLNNTRTFSPQSDLYSLAATFYYLLTATVPPEALDNRPERLHFPEGVPANARKAIVKAMAMHADERHKSISDFLWQLDNQSIASDSEQTVINNDSEHTEINQDPEQTSINEDTEFEQPEVIKKQATPVTPHPVKSTGSGNKTFGFIAVGIAVVVAAIILASRFSNSDHDNYDPETDFITDVTEPDSLPTPAAEEAAAEEEAAAVEASTSGDAMAAEEAVAPEPSSPYGPFNSRNEVADFLQKYLEAAQGGVDFTPYLAQNITTDYGTEKRHNKYDFYNDHIKKLQKSGYIGSDFDYNWSSLITNPLPDGGLDTTFNYIYTRYDRNDDGSTRTRVYRCNIEAKINASGQIYYIKEKAEKLN